MTCDDLKIEMEDPKSQRVVGAICRDAIVLCLVEITDQDPCLEGVLKLSQSA